MLIFISSWRASNVCKHEHNIISLFFRFVFLHREYLYFLIKFYDTNIGILLLWFDSSAQMPYILFTGLEDYKARGTQASPFLTVTHYTEFADSKDIVLIRGDVVFTSKLSDSEAKWLMETAQSFYLNDTRFKLVERFNKETHEFEFKDVLQALEMPMQ